MSALHRWMAVALVGMLAPATVVSAAVTFHVHPAGSDLNPGTADRPFRTMSKARDVVRARSTKSSDDIVVLLRGGTYAIRQTAVFEPADSGTERHPITYRAKPGEEVVISGGVKLTGWTREADGKRWKTKTDIPNFRQLHVNGRRAIRAQGPPPGGLALEGKSGYRTEAVEMADWRNPTDIEFCYRAVWTHSRCKVASITKEGSQATITMLQPWFTMAREKEGVSIELPSYIENALELLDEPGEWHLDRSRHEVYYLPRPGEDMTKAEVVVPVVEQLLEFRGTVDAPVANLVFEGITFADADWLGASETGFVDLQANFTLAPGTNLLTRDRHVTMLHNEAIKSPAHIICRGTHRVAFDRCVFTRLGGAGIDFELGAQANRVDGCQFFDIGGSAIQIGNVLRADHHPDDPRLVVRSNAVTHCEIHDCACLYQGGVGIFAGYTDGTYIGHNLIHDLPYSAISIGWGWGEEDAGGSSNYFQPFHYNTPTTAGNNLVADNHVFRVMQRMEDGGAIYTLGNQPGTVIRGNHLHDSKGKPGGIYLDEGSGFIEVTSNVVYGVHTPINYNNRVQDRIKSCREHDNYLNPESGRNPAPGKPPEANSAIQRIVNHAGPAAGN